MTQIEKAARKARHALSRLERAANGTTPANDARFALLVARAERAGVNFPKILDAVSTRTSKAVA